MTNDTFFALSGRQMLFVSTERNGRLDFSVLEGYQMTIPFDAVLRRPLIFLEYDLEQEFKNWQTSATAPRTSQQTMRT